jgi:hypothetical protein
VIGFWLVVWLTTLSSGIRISVVSYSSNSTLSWKTKGLFTQRVIFVLREAARPN